MTPEAAADKLEIVELCTVKHWIYDHDDWAAYDTVFADVVSFPAGQDVDPEAYLDRFLVPKAELAGALRDIKAGLLTQHLITGHRVELRGDAAVCWAHSINIHFPRADVSSETLLAKGNEYRFDCVRTNAGWRIRGFIAKNIWAIGNTAAHDAAAKLSAFSAGQAG